MRIDDFSQSKWDNLYRSYKERYAKQAKRTPMEERYSLAEFKAYYVGISNESGMGKGAGTSQVLSKMVNGQKDVLSRKQNAALISNLEQFIDNPDAPAEVRKFLDTSGYFDANTVMKKNTWAIMYGAAFRNLLEEIEVDSWAHYFNS